jgi:DNA-binding NarL/FixJ family response regulator
MMSATSSLVAQPGAGHRGPRRSCRRRAGHRRRRERLPAQDPARVNHLAAALEKLTAREREILELLAKGSSNLEVARALFVSETTAKTHVRNVLAKLDLRDRVHAVVFAYESGLVRPGGP